MRWGSVAPDVVSLLSLPHMLVVAGTRHTLVVLLMVVVAVAFVAVVVVLAMLLLGLCTWGCIMPTSAKWLSI